MGLGEITNVEKGQARKKKGDKRNTISGKKKGKGEKKRNRQNEKDKKNKKDEKKNRNKKKNDDKEDKKDDDKKNKKGRSGKSSDLLPEFVYNQLWCFDLAMEQALEKCVEDKLNN